MSRSSSRFTSGRSSTPRTSVKMAAFAPMPSASVSTTVIARPFARASDRKAIFKSFANISGLKFIFVSPNSTWATAPQNPILLNSLAAQWKQRAQSRVAQAKSGPYEHAESHRQDPGRIADAHVGSCRAAKVTRHQYGPENCGPRNYVYHTAEQFDDPEAPPAGSPGIRSAQRTATREPASVA